jgi:uncharacterized protein (TIGR02466 family)
MRPIHIFEHLIWQDRYEGPLDLIKNRAVHLLSTSSRLNSGLELGGGLSSSSDPSAPHYWRESQPFLEWLIPNVNEVWRHWGFPNSQRKFNGSWVNIHPKGAWTAEHQHRSTPLVAVLYLSQPDNGGYLEIADPLFYHWNGSKKPTDDTWREIPVQTGDVVIFPGWINHRTQKNQSTEDRYVISFNIG